MLLRSLLVLTAMAVMAKAQIEEIILFHPLYGSCAIRDGKIYRRGILLREMTEADRNELQRYRNEEEAWRTSLNSFIQNQIDTVYNNYATVMNRIFGPQLYFPLYLQSQQQQQYLQHDQSILEASTATTETPAVFTTANTVVPTLTTESPIQILPRPQIPSFCMQFE